MQLLRDAQARSTPQWAGAAAVPWLEPVTHESPCFAIERVEVLDAPLKLAALAEDIGQFAGACLGPKSIEALRRNLDARLAALGYVTSSLSLPAQNLSDGVLRLQLHLGRVARLERRGGALGVARNALALRPGEVLNLRDIEQTLENLARLPSQAAQFQIEPADTPEASVLVMAAPEQRRWRVSAGLDNSGARDFGRWQATAQLVLDAPLGLSDQLTANATRNVQDAGGEKRQRSTALSYSLPWGYHLFSVSGSRSEHARPIQGLSTRFSENGHDSSVQARWQWTAWRGANARWAVWAGATERRTRNFVDDVELVLQRRHARTQDWGLNGWLRTAAGEFSLEWENSRSVRLPLATDFAQEPPALARTGRAQLSWQRELGGLPYSARLAWAGVHEPASGADLQNLGSRWSVRGFDAQGFLTGQEQLTLKQDLRWPGFEWRSLALQPYAGADLGRVSAAPSSGRELAGAVAGLRFQRGHASGDFALAAPVHKPQGFQAASAVIYASFNFNY